jgi:ABC-type Fe3+ transport system permease subunit
MDVYDFIAIFSLLMTAVVVCAGGWFLLELPGKMAAERKHPQADAIRVCGWLGLMTAGLFWAFALVWVFRPFDTTTQEPSN